MASVKYYNSSSNTEKDQIEVQPEAGGLLERDREERNSTVDHGGHIYEVKNR